VMTVLNSRRGRRGGIPPSSLAARWIETSQNVHWYFVHAGFSKLMKMDELTLEASGGPNIVKRIVKNKK
jgi:hypothetical protein